MLFRSDVSGSEGRDPVEDFDAINAELKQYSPDLAERPQIVAANKVDDARLESEAAAMWNLGLGEPYAVSALHGRGSGDLLDAILQALPEAPAEQFEEVGGPTRVAIIGKPNVGKSSLLNKLTGRQRSVVNDMAGTTVDPVDELVELDGEVYRFIDTAGIRRRVKEASGHEYYASLRTQQAIERAQVCIVVIDASESIADQDLKLLTMVEQSGKALVVAYNKWDLTDDERRRYLEREVERDVQAFAWAPHVNISALTGRNVDKLRKAIGEIIGDFTPWILCVDTTPIIGDSRVSYSSNVSSEHASVYELIGLMESTKADFLQ